MVIFPLGSKPLHFFPVICGCLAAAVLVSYVRLFDILGLSDGAVPTADCCLFNHLLVPVSFSDYLQHLSLFLQTKRAVEH